MDRIEVASVIALKTTDVAIGLDNLLVSEPCHGHLDVIAHCKLFRNICLEHFVSNNSNRSIVTWWFFPIC